MTDSSTAIAQPSINQMRGGAARTGHQLKALGTVSAHTIDVLDRAGHGVAARSVQAASRAAIDGHIDIVVAGEFKAGKTTVVNGILGQRLLPTDLLRAGTAPVRVRPGAKVGYAATVVDLDAGEMQLANLEPAAFALLAGADSPAVRGKPVDQFHVTCPHPLLDLGIRLVDTPGVTGGLKSVSARRVLQQARQARALVWVSDASRELAGSELEFLAEAGSSGLTILIVMTKIDLYPEWHRVLERNEAHLARLDRLPQVLAVGAGLQHLAARLEAPDLERESGFPLLSWYLGVNVLAAARHHATSAAADLIVAELGSAKAAVEDRLRSMASVDARRELEVTADESLADLKALSDTWRYRLTGYQKESIKTLDEDLGRRLTVLKDHLRDQLRQAESVDDWPIIEDAVTSGINRVFANHILELDRICEGTLGRVADELGLSRDQLQGLQATADIGPAPSLGGHLDEPEVGGYGERPTKVMDLLRTSAIGGSLAATAAQLSVFGALQFVVPVVGAVGVGSLVGLRFMGRLRRGQQLDQWRAKAGPEIDRFLRQSESDIRRGAGRALDAFHLSLDVTVPGLIKELLRERSIECERLRKLADRATATPSDAEVEIRELLDRIELVESHGQRLQMHLRRPERELYA